MRAAGSWWAAPQESSPWASQHAFPETADFAYVIPLLYYSYRTERGIYQVFSGLTQGGLDSLDEMSGRELGCEVILSSAYGLFLSVWHHADFAILTL